MSRYYMFVDNQTININSCIICPYCGKRQSDPFKGESRTFRVMCDDCNKKFEVTTIKSLRYFTFKVKSLQGEING